MRAVAEYRVEYADKRHRKGAGKRRITLPGGLVLRSSMSAEEIAENLKETRGAQDSDLEAKIGR